MSVHVISAKAQTMNGPRRVRVGFDERFTAAQALWLFKNKLYPGALDIQTESNERENHG